MDKKTIRIAFSDGGHFCQKLLFRLLNSKYEFVIDQSNPDLLVYSLYGNQHLRYNCKKLQIIGENSFPNFNECDYAISPHYISFDRHCRIPFYAFNKEYQLLIDWYIDRVADPEKRKFCCGLITNGINADPFRDEFVKQLNKAMPIDSVGKWLNTTGWTIQNRPEFAENRDSIYTNPAKIRLCRNYKYTLALENSLVDGYHTEKITDAFAAYSVPIYWGSKSISNEFNSGSYINVADFGTIQEAVDYILSISDEEYAEMLNCSPKVIATTYYDELRHFVDYVISGPVFEHKYGNFAVQNQC